MALKYLLDTNILSEPLRTVPDARVMDNLRLQQHHICTTAMVWHELWYGAARLSPGARRTRIERYLHEVVLATLPLLPYDASAASWHAQERARLEKKGRTPPFVDGMIAAVAAVNKLVLVTHNLADYRGFADIDLVTWREK
jgi:tRNA(fMet)-specific endonuclease VapC